MTRPEPNNMTPPPGIGEADSETLRRAITLVRALRDPALPGLLFLVGIAVAGLVVIVVTVFSVSGAPHVALQMPFLVSGGLAGTALVAVGAVLAAVLAERRDRAIARVEMQQTVDELAALVLIAANRRRRG